MNDLLTCVTHRFLLMLLLLGSVSLSAQSVYVSKFVAGQPDQAEDRLFRIELFNESPTVFLEISGWLVLTRYHAFRLPPNTFLKPMESLRIGRKSQSGDLDIAFSRLPNWVERKPESSEGGDFVAIMDADLKLVDAFYFGGQQEVSFLPSEELLYIPGEEVLKLTAPAESDPRWEYLRAIPDPAFAFYYIGGQWRVGSRSKNILPANQYRYLKTSFEDGSVNLKWVSAQEKDCFFHQIERSTDGSLYRNLDLVPAKGSAPGETPYVYYDRAVESNRLYYYRVSNRDKFGNVLLSNPSKIRTEEQKGQFSLEVIRDRSPQDAALNVRFAALREQEVRVQLMDEELREVAVLFYGQVQAEKQNYLSYGDRLPIGKYYVIVNTEGRRYYEPFIVE